MMASTDKYQQFRRMAWRWQFVLGQLVAGSNAQRIAAQWEVTPKTIQRDIDFLKRLGVDVSWHAVHQRWFVSGTCPLCHCANLGLTATELAQPSRAMKGPNDQARTDQPDPPKQNRRRLGRGA